MDRVRMHINKARELILAPSYSDCLRCIDNLTLIEKEELISRIKNLNSLYSEKDNMANGLAEIKKQYKTQTTHGESIDPGDQTNFFVLFLPIGYVMAWLFFCIEYVRMGSWKSAAWITGLIIGAFWPLGSLVGILKGKTSMEYLLMRGAVQGIVIAAIVSALLWCVLYVRRKGRLSHKSKISNIKDQLSHSRVALEDLRQKIQGERDGITKQLAEIKW